VQRITLDLLLQHPWLSAEYKHEEELVHQVQDVMTHSEAHAHANAHNPEFIRLSGSAQSPAVVRKTPKHPFLSRFIDSFKHLFSPRDHSHPKPDTPTC
jgi:hypothetical protein